MGIFYLCDRMSREQNYSIFGSKITAFLSVGPESGMSSRYIFILDRN